MKMFIDDERFPPDSNFGVIDDWVIIRSFPEFKHWVKSNGYPDTLYISFDHDLGDPEIYGTGYDIAKWIVLMDMTNDYPIPAVFDFYVHSQNPIGKKNIESYLNGYLSFRGK